MKKLTCIGSLAVVLGLGCGGGAGSSISEGPKVAKGTANVSTMNAGVGQASTINSALMAGNGDVVASGALSLSNLGSSAVSGGGMALTVARAMDVVNADTGTTGSKNCSATGCIFKDYGVDGGFTLTGSVTTSDAGAGMKSVVWDLSGSGDTSAFGGLAAAGGDIKFTFNWKGDINVSATSIDGAAGGAAKGSGSAQGQSFSFVQGSYIKFDQVGMVDGCATSGSVRAKHWVSAKSGGRSQTEGAEATHTYNGCTK